MDKLSKEIIGAFIKLTRKGFANWLWQGLNNFYSLPVSERAMAFEPAGYYVLQQESVVEGLATVYDRFIPSHRQDVFRQSISDVIREHGEKDDVPIDIFKDLIYLMMRIEAIEPLVPLVSAVGRGSLGKRHPELLYETLTLLKSLAPGDPRDNIYGIAVDLIDSPNFDDGYLIEAIKVLAVCLPSMAYDMVLKYQSRLRALRQMAQEAGGDEWIAFCEAVSLCNVDILIACQRIFGNDELPIFT